MAGIQSLAGAVRALRSGHGDPHHIWMTTIEPIVHAEGWIYGDVPTDPHELLRFVDALLVEYQREITRAWEEL